MTSPHEAPGPAVLAAVTPWVEPPDGNRRAVLVLSAGWIIDRSAEVRLGRQLARAASDVSGVVATTEELPPGSSYRTYSERLAMRPLSRVEEMRSRSVRGAVLLRAGIKFASQDERIVIESEGLIVDHGAHAHNPWGGVESLQLAGADSRPPFPWRPVVVFLACEPGGPHHGDELLELINDLQDEDIESRLAAPDMPHGRRHLVQPCLAHPASMRTLSPDVVVALDPTALARSDTWCGSARGTTLIEYSPATTKDVQLVSWQIGHASGRLRARIGQGVEAGELAGLIRRLSAGPHPAPPHTGDDETPVIRTWSGPTSSSVRVRRKPRSVMILAGESGDAARARFEGLRDHVDGTAATVDLLSIDQGIPSRARTADVVILSASDGSDAVRDLIRVRGAAKRPTAVALGPSDSSEPQGAGSAPTLTAAAIELLDSCGLAIVPTLDYYHALLSGRDVRTFVMPMWLTRQRVDELGRVRSDRGPRTVVVGWRYQAERPQALADLEIVAVAVRQLLADRPDVLVDVVGTSGAVGLPQHPRLRPVHGDIRPRALRRWVAQLWTPSVRDLAMNGDIRPILEATHLGVPTVLSSIVARAIGVDSSGSVVVTHPEEPSDWTGVIGSLLDDEDHRWACSEPAMRRSDDLNTPETAALSVERFLGWALHGSKRS